MTNERRYAEQLGIKGAAALRTIRGFGGIERMEKMSPEARALLVKMAIQSRNKNLKAK